MPEIAHSPAPPLVSDGKRRLRNYLLDARFQLKFTGYILSIAIVISGVLGVFLYRNSRDLMREAEHAVEARSRAAETSKELSSATLANELMKNFDDPVFAESLKQKSAQIDASYEAEKNSIIQQRQELVRKQRVIWLILVGCLVAFVLFIALASIVTTHKIVGPLFRIKRLVNDINLGRLSVPTYPLRQGDELQDVFEAMTSMVQSLRNRQVQDLRRIEELIEAARALGQEPLLATLQGLHGEMKARLD
ncbi:MAG: HAMP domain-containing protein [Myxococcota bacterium]|nr:HAMP domain-containing protein [Myxococcota bacterium]